LTGPSAADVLLGDEAAETLATPEHGRDPKARAIARRIRSLREVLLNDCLHGDVVRKSSIPRILARKHSIENLYVEDMPDFWRLLYTIARRNGKPFVVIIEIVDHRKYSRWFPGKRG
jgi:hypothetical protein